MNNKIKKIIILMLLFLIAFSTTSVFAVSEETVNAEENIELINIVEDNIEVETEEEVVTTYPKFKIQSIKAKKGDTVELQLNIDSEIFIQSGGLIISCSSAFQNMECIAGENYNISFLQDITAVESPIQNIGIAFAAKNENGEAGEVNLCTLKFKIPNNFDTKQNSVVSVKSVDSIYSADYFIGSYYSEDGIIEFEQESLFDNKIMIIGIVAVVVMVFVVIIVLIKKRKK